MTKSRNHVPAEARPVEPGRAPADVDQARAQAATVRYRKANLLDEMNVNVETAFANLQSSVSKLQASRKAMESAKISYEATRAVFCSFLALVLRKELQQRLAQRGHQFEWAHIKKDFKELQLLELEENGTRMVIRTECKECCGKVLSGKKFLSTVKLQTRHFACYVGRPSYLNFSRLRSFIQSNVATATKTQHAM